MRLSKIKLSGFKSFVDPTTFEFPSNLIGVVGPNGCGKSNTIDAVRWVMGESSARYLRGASMEDVIFTGSSHRKPVAQAFAELIFDNSDGTVGGEYSKYSEVSVKRLVTRDGKSKYFLNGSRCRRRDITDIFLGTGLGPRSYAIIEQGMISRLVESRPEELRVFLEEAAGISKYKERRRETENRIKNTRENLERLDDLRNEIVKHLEKLHRQSEVAKRFKQHKITERQLIINLQVFNWKQLDLQYTQIQQQQREQEIQLEKTLAEQRSIENDIEKERDKFVDANDKINEIQGEFYKIGSELSRLEQTIKFNKDSELRQQQETQQNEKALLQVQSHLEQDQQTRTEYITQLEETGEEFEIIVEQEQEQSLLLEEHQESLNNWENNWRQHQEAIRKPSETAQVEKSKMEHIERLVVQNEQRVQRYQQELALIGQEDIFVQIEGLEEKEMQLEEQEAILEQQVQTSQEALEQAKIKTSELDEQQNQHRLEKQTLTGRVASIKALQDAAKVDYGKVITNYMQRHSIVFASLMDSIDVNEGWEQAVEMVLEHNMATLCIDSLDVLDQATLPAGLQIIEKSDHNNASQAGLLSEVRTQYNLANWLGGIQLSDSLTDALSKRSSLQDQQSYITKDAIWVGKTWIKMPQKEQQQDSFLKREKVLLQEQMRLDEVNGLLDECQQIVKEQKENLKTLDATLRQTQKEFNQIHREKSQQSSQLHALKSKAQQVEERKQNLTQEIEELHESTMTENQALIDATKNRNEALENLQLISVKTESLSQQRNELQLLINELKNQHSETLRQKQMLEIQLETIRTKQQAMQANSSRMEEQREHLLERQETLAEERAENQEPIAELEGALQKGIKQKRFIEQDLQEARKVAEQIDHQIRQMEQSRLQREQQVQKIRELHEKIMIEGQIKITQKEVLEEQIDASGFDRDTVINNLEHDIDVAKLEHNINQIRQRIERLGAINLAAIDEYQEESKRKEYLDDQHADITEALLTLEKAINKIDQETKSRFKETYDKVNTTLQELFPKLFGGGRAYLELTGDDLLDTGVSIMARPPGKKVSSIQLLSGGEKAMTAVALIFSFFELNPAPFCMLDEVDAPLDDANVGRFCEMVKAMSDRVQFIFITHNKVTMELSNQLIGVTMQEPGVSRMVSVNLSEAEHMVGAN
jgi:chromosome segregation protein